MPRKKAVNSKNRNEYTSEETKLLKAVDEWRFENKGQTPAITEVLKIMKKLGYRKGIGR